jgi:hypothetical protein
LPSFIFPQPSKLTFLRLPHHSLRNITNASIRSSFLSTRLYLVLHPPQAKIVEHTSLISSSTRTQERERERGFLRSIHVAEDSRSRSRRRRVFILGRTMILGSHAARYNMLQVCVLSYDRAKSVFRAKIIANCSHPSTLSLFLVLSCFFIVLLNIFLSASILIIAALCSTDSSLDQ